LLSREIFKKRKNIYNAR